MEAGTLLYGGSFNPLHIGHMRLMLGALDWLAGMVSHGEFIPTGDPPHKPGRCLLPFDLRARIIRASISEDPALSCNEIEGTLPGPSYTKRTLTILGGRHDKANLFFLLGSQDFGLLREWKDGLDLPLLCNLVIAPRGDYNKNDFRRQARDFWPDCEAAGDFPDEPCMNETGFSLRFACGTRAFWLPLPWLDISATRIRAMWLCGRNINYLMPDAGVRILDESSDVARRCWQEKECSK